MKFFKSAALLIALISTSISWAIPHKFGTQLKSCDPKVNNTFNYSPVPVRGPDLKKMPYTCEGNIKTFELKAEEVFTLFHI